MAHPQHYRVRPQILAEDIEAFLVLDSLTGYQPSNPAYSYNAAAQAYAALQAAQKAELQILSAAAAARDTTVAAQWRLHATMLGVKDQVKAQFGADSDQLAALGLKKKSERRAPSRKGAG